MKSATVKIGASLMCFSMTFTGCAKNQVNYLGAAHSAALFAEVCGAAANSANETRAAFLRRGFRPREQNSNAFNHPNLSAFGWFAIDEGGPVTTSDGRVVAFAKPSRRCEMEFAIPRVESCEKSTENQKMEVAKFRQALGNTLGPDKDLQDINSRGVYIRPGGGGKLCILRIAATVTFD